MATAAFTTLGCKVNQYETQRILESFEQAGFDVVPFDAPADVYVINSCSVTGIAESKSRYTIRRARRQNPSAKVVVTGCASQMALNRGEEVPGADLVVPNPAKLEALQQLLAAYPDMGTGLEARPAGLVPSWQRGRTRATLKIQDGCSVLCSYCSIPVTRPGMTSRPAAEILDEAQRLAAMGYQEIVLTGVLIGAYGPETGSGGPRFERLVEMLARDSGVPRIRISSIEMRQVTPEVVELIRSGLVTPHLHIPLQSGDSGVLADMNRPYTQDDYLRLTDRLRESIPGISLTTDILVGFPTETEERFQGTLHVCRRAGFLKAHVFRFSPRPGTPAERWGDPVPATAKQDRSDRVTAISTESGRQHVRQYLGKTVRVLAEGRDRRTGLAHGLSDPYIEVRFPGPDDVMRKLCLVRLETEAEGVAYGERVSDEGPWTEIPQAMMASSNRPGS